jgi:hypothetical protein
MADKKIIFDVLAVAKAEGFEAAAAKVDRLNDSATRSQKNLGLLSTSIVALGPALIPVAAAGAAALTGLGASAGVALLAFEGLKKEWQAGTLQATDLGQQITTLQLNLGKLESTAASGVAPGLTKGLQDINGLMPLVNRDVAQLSGQLGQVAGHVGAGLVTLFTRLNPLFTALGDELVRDSAKFQAWATSSGSITKFVNYALGALPDVEQTIKDLFTTASHIVQAFGGFGGTSLTAIRLFSAAINKIPISVLQELVPLLVGLKIASTAAAALNNLTLALQRTAVAEGEATVATRTLTVAMDALNPAVAGVIGLYYLLGPVLDKVSGNTGTFSDMINTLRGATLEAIPPPDNLASKVHKLGGVSGIAANNLQAAAAATGNAAAAQQALSVTVDGTTTKLDKQTTAANLLKDAFDRLNGTSLSLEQTQNQFLDTLAGLNKRTKDYNGTLAQNNATGRANREVIVQAIQAANDHAQAVANQTAKTRGLVAGLRAGSADLAAHEGAIRRAAAAAGLDKNQVDALIRSLGRIPRNVRSNIQLTGAQLAANQAATIRDTLNALHDKHVTVTLDQYTNIFQSVYKRQALAGRQSGGRVLRGHQYMVNEAGQELFVRDNDGAALIGGGPRLWTAPASGQIINASTLRALRSRVSAAAVAPLQAIPGAAASAISAVAKILPFGSPITRALEKEDRLLEQLVNRRNNVAGRLKAANQRLVSEMQSYQQEAATVRGAVVGSFDLLNAGKDVYGNITAGGILSDLGTSVGTASLFAKDLRLLSKRGLNRSVLQQLAEAGPSALPTVQALLGASGGQLRQFNALYGQLGSAGAAAGAITASALYGRQIAATRALIRGLSSEERALVRLERKLDKTIVKSINITIHGGDAKTIIRELDQYLHINTARALKGR